MFTRIITFLFRFLFTLRRTSDYHWSFFKGFLSECLSVCACVSVRLWDCGFVFTWCVCVRARARVRACVRVHLPLCACVSLWESVCVRREMEQPKPCVAQYLFLNQDLVKIDSSAQGDKLNRLCKLNMYLFCFQPPVCPPQELKKTYKASSLG